MSYLHEPYTESVTLIQDLILVLLRYKLLIISNKNENDFSIIDTVNGVNIPLPEGSMY